MKNTEYRYINNHGAIMYAEGHEVTRHKHGGEKMTMFRTNGGREYPANWTRTEKTVPASWKKQIASDTAYLDKMQAELNELKNA